MAVLHVLMSSVGLNALVLPSSSLAMKWKDCEDRQHQGKRSSADYMHIPIQIDFSSVGHSLWNKAAS